MSTPVFAEYAQKNDLGGYLKALWTNANEDDLGSLHALLYLAIQCEETDAIMTFIEALDRLGDEFTVFLVALVYAQGEELPEEDQQDDAKLIAIFKSSYPLALEEYPEHPDFAVLFGKRHNDLLRAYLNGVGREEEDETPETGGEEAVDIVIRRLFASYEQAGEWDKAFPLLERLATEFDDRKYCLKLADWYCEGKGCEKDEQKAFALVQDVYQHSSVTPYSSVHDDAANMLAHYYANGIGCEKDEQKAGHICWKLKSDWDDLDDVLSR